MDDDSPFAKFDTPRPAKKVGWSHVGTMRCRQCKHEWLVPVVAGGAISKKCPNCGSDKKVLKDGSVVNTPPPSK